MAKKPASPPQKKRVLLKTDTSLFDRWEERFDKNQNKWLLASLLISLLFSVLLFDIKISDLNDDSLYIEGGYNLAQDINHEFTANAPLYPLILSIPIKFFGINLVILKSISIIFTFLHLWILFLAFRKRIPYMVIFPVMILLAANSFIQFFASLTFTEPLYMLLQAVFFYYFLLALEKTKDDNSFKTNWKYWLMVGVTVFLLGFTKNIAVGVIVVVGAVLILQRRWAHLLYAAGGILAVRIPTDFIRSLIWGTGQYTSQKGMLMQVDPYNKSKGMETAAGFIQRFFDNTSLYISKRLYQILGFIDIDSVETKGGLILITVVLFIIALIAALRSKNNTIIVCIVFSLIMMALTFVVLQKHWDQARYIMVFLPYILIIFFYAFYMSVRKQPSIIQFIYLVFIVIFIGSSFISTTAKSVQNFPKLKKNIAGDRYYGYTEDWVNFLKMSAYVADSMPENTYAVSRKAPMSFIYGNGKKYYAVYNVFSDNADTVLTTFKDAGVTHVIVASLRRNPKKVDGYTINTIQRLISPMANKYPRSLILEKQIGETEPAFLYRIDYGQATGQ